MPDVVLSAWGLSVNVTDMDSILLVLACLVGKEDIKQALQKRERERDVMRDDFKVTWGHSKSISFIIRNQGRLSGGICLLTGTKNQLAVSQACKTFSGQTISGSDSTFLSIDFLRRHLFSA